MALASPPPPGPRLHLGALEARRTTHRQKRCRVEGPPVAGVVVELVALDEPAQRQTLGEPEDLRLRLDDRGATRHGRQPLEGEQGVANVVEDAEVEDDVEGPE